MAVKFYNAYNSKPIKDGISFKGMPEVCNQQAAEECEISKLLYQFEAGEIDQLPVVREAVYNDIMITPQSLEQAQALLDKVNADFFSLPKEEQRKFGDIKTYVKDIQLMASGDAETLAKYSRVQVTSPNASSDVNQTSSSGIPSSSISRSDSGIGSTNLEGNNNNTSAVKGE